ncbi:MAG TPA: YncE family protein [Streptosporangiaceae bacterium]|nr:YncE family protein [Streptosporangiaceae bacterium]
MVLIGGCASSGSRPESSTSASGSPSATSSPSAATGGALAQAPVGSGPVNAALDQKTETLYVTNYNNATVSVLSMARCNSHKTAGCARSWPVAAVGMNPVGIAVDQATNTIYVTNSGDATVSVINGATCNGDDTSGCRQKAATVRVGAFPAAVAVDPVTNMVFVANQDTHPGTVSVIDGNSCEGSRLAGCAHQPFTTTAVGGGPSGVDINPVTDTIYVANAAEDSNSVPLPHGSTLSVINGATCKVTSKSGCRPVGTVRVGTDPADVSVDPATNTIYVANTYDHTSAETGTVSVVNGATCDATHISGCASQIAVQVPVGIDPISVAFDQVTETVYVTNWKDQTLSVIKTARCNAAQASGCKAPSGTITVGSAPSWTVVNLPLKTVYVVVQSTNSVAVLGD